MNRLYVAGQDPDSREWIPVAELIQTSDGYTLRYTRGAIRLPKFWGLGRMQDLHKVYYSRSLFPFFSNRIISKSRPEYKNYMHWLGLEKLPSSSLEVLGITGGVRATDNFELLAAPQNGGKKMVLNIFPRGLRYQSPEVIAQFMTLKEGSRVYLMNDSQNPKDSKAIAIRSEQPHAMFIGYVPRYYCPGLQKILSTSPKSIKGHIKRVNADAPLDMKLLLSFEAEVAVEFDLLASTEDCQPLSEIQVAQYSSNTAPSEQTGN